MHFIGGKAECYLHAILRSNFTMIRVPEKLTRAKKNSIALFDELSNAKVSEVSCIENERCLVMIFDNDLSVLFKMFGHQSNVLICREGRPFKIFKNNLKEDLSLRIEELGRAINITQEALSDADWDFTKLWPALGGKVKMHIFSLGYHQMGPNEKFLLIDKILRLLDTPEFFINHQEALPILTLFKPEKWVLRSNDVLLALNEFFLQYVRAEKLHLIKKEILGNLEKKKRRAQAVVKKSQQRLRQLQQGRSYRELADIIMANLHQIPANTALVNLPDFITGSPVAIKLKTTLSPQKNAEQYYRKSKNQSKEVDVLKRNLEVNQAQLDKLEDHLTFVKNCGEIKVLSQYANEHRLVSSKRTTEQKPPFREVVYQGFRIFIGRNAVNNDLLTQKYAHKDDIWLHAKDVRGSHVVIKQNPGQDIPMTVIEKAAQLAAYYSKRKHDSLCPVAYTPKKYVRKRKGSAAGEVIVEREKVLLVVPEAESFSDSNFK